MNKGKYLLKRLEMKCVEIAKVLGVVEGSKICISNLYERTN
ncbi:hypothetical protein bcere0022_24130 [Bacillus cereus Rock3-44]|nr:hypothetical protein bcere0022_24130 [Bacillus cereus Rock3-44]